MALIRRTTPMVAVWAVEAQPDTWPSGGPMYRAHSARYPADAFNPRPDARYRFSPVERPDGQVVASWYGGSTPECAVAETLLHDIPIGTGGTLRTPQFTGRRISMVRPTRPLRLARLDSDGLRALRVEPQDATDTEADGYGRTRLLAQQLYDTGDLDGLVWMSRRRNIDAAVVLYQDKIVAGDLEPATVVHDFDTDEGWQWLHDTLVPLNVHLAPPVI